MRIEKRGSRGRKGKRKMGNGGGGEPGIGKKNGNGKGRNEGKWELGGTESGRENPDRLLHQQPLGALAYFFGTLNQLARTVADHYVVHLWAAAELFFEAFLRSGDEGFVQFVLHQVDGTTAEAATHDA